MLAIYGLTYALNFNYYFTYHNYCYASSVCWLDLFFSIQYHLLVYLKQVPKHLSSLPRNILSWLGQTIPHSPALAVWQHPTSYMFHFACLERLFEGSSEDGALLFGHKNVKTYLFIHICMQHQHTPKDLLRI